MNPSVIAYNFLENIAIKLEDIEGLDVDFDGKILIIETASGQQYLLNFHEPTNQLWLSSPITGAHHFEWIDELWRSTRSPQTLVHILTSELNTEITL